MIHNIDDLIEEQLPTQEPTHPFVRLAYHMITLDQLVYDLITDRTTVEIVNNRSRFLPQSIGGESFLVKTMAAYVLLHVQNPDTRYQIRVARTPYGSMPYLRQGENLYTPGGYDPTNDSTRCIDTAEEIVRSDDRIGASRFSSLPALIQYYSLNSQEQELLNRSLERNSDFLRILTESSLNTDRRNPLLRAILTMKLERAVENILRQYPPQRCGDPSIPAILTRRPIQLTVPTIGAGTENDVLYYFSRSASKPVGRGVNENVANVAQYSELNAIPGWRQVLSNFFIGEFEFEGRHYRTAEHAFQQAKIRIADPALADTFATESGSLLSQGDGEAARAQRKAAILTPAQLREWNQIKDDVMERILLAKFSQVPVARRVLLATNNAQLWHGAPRVARERQHALERVRERIRNAQ